MARLRRLAARSGSIPLLLITSFIVFSFIHIAPGSPEQVLLGGKNVDAETLQAIRDRYRLDDPFLVQYWHWLTNAVSGDFGESIASTTRLERHLRPHRADTPTRRLRHRPRSSSSASASASSRPSSGTAPVDTAVSGVTLVVAPRSRPTCRGSS